MKDDIILQVENLHTGFLVDNVPLEAVSGVSFSLKAGRVLGVVGESGCGRSVTAHSIMQLLPKYGRITEGSITYTRATGEKIEIQKLRRTGNQMRQIRGKEISMIFQDPMSSLNPVYPIGDQIAENIREHEKVTKREALDRARKLLEDLEIPSAAERLGDYPHQFSGGMKQRVMIAIAMACNPRILIADEPTTALDVTIQAQIIALMKKLQREHGTSIMMITHNMGLVAEMADDIAVMYMGRIVEYGSIRQVMKPPAHPYTQGLLKAVPVLGMKKDRLYSIKGSTPSLVDRPAGCEFASRCEYATEACRQAPRAVEVEPGHQVRCWNYKEATDNG